MSRWREISVKWLMISMSAKCERIFSSAGMMIVPKRLNDDIMEASECLRS